MCRLRNMAMRDYQESVTTGQTDKHTDGHLYEYYFYNIRPNFVRSSMSHHASTTCGQTSASGAPTPYQHVCPVDSRLSVLRNLGQIEKSVGYQDPNGSGTKLHDKPGPHLLGTIILTLSIPHSKNVGKLTTVTSTICCQMIQAVRRSFGLT